MTNQTSNTKKPNIHAQILGRRGGQVRSPAKRAAQSANRKAFWDQVRRGEKPHPWGLPTVKGEPILVK